MPAHKTVRNPDYTGVDAQRAERSQSLQPKTMAAAMPACEEEGPR